MGSRGCCRSWSSRGRGSGFCCRRPHTCGCCCRLRQLERTARSAARRASARWVPGAPRSRPDSRDVSGCGQIPWGPKSCRLLWGLTGGPVSVSEDIRGLRIRIPASDSTRSYARLFFFSSYLHLNLAGHLTVCPSGRMSHPSSFVIYPVSLLFTRRSH